jgi:hypothetical protein
MTRHEVSALACACCITSLATPAAAEQRQESFDKDPAWDARNNRSTAYGPRPVRQDFGYSATSHSGGPAGEIGGFTTPDAEPAWYAKGIKPRTLADAFSASGRLVVPKGKCNTLIGFFNADTLNEWRTPNTLVIRVNARGEVFQVHVEYTTARWRSGAGMLAVRSPQSGRFVEKEVPCGATAHGWSLMYDPRANNDGGRITLTFDGESAACNLSPGHKLDGATFNRFGILNVMKSADDGGELWLDALVIDGAREDLRRDLVLRYSSIDG